MLLSKRMLFRILSYVLLAVMVVNLFGFFWKQHRTRATTLSQTATQKPLQSSMSAVSSIKAQINYDSQELTAPEEFKRRQKFVEDFCAQRPNDVTGNIKGVFTDSTAGVIYCFVPKTGCTFWKQVFQFQLLKGSQKYKSPWSIPRDIVHFNQHSSGSHYDEHVHSPTKYPTRLLVSRNPFSRLLSSYLDKIYLPDFWIQEKHMASDVAVYHEREKSKENAKKDFLRTHFDNMASKLEPFLYLTNGNTTENYRKSPKFVTFSEFLRVSLNDMEPHWMPIHTRCNPCIFKPTHISKMETFTQDARVIMKSMKLDQFLDDFDKHQQVDRELQTIIDYNFNKFSAGKSQYLANDWELAYRLWNNFVWRGYIHPHVEYIPPKNLTNGHTREDLILQVKNARELGRREPQIMRKAKHDFEMAAYRTLDKQLFEGIVSKFRTDFELFGYNSSLEKLRSELFPSLNSSSIMS